MSDRLAAIEARLAAATPGPWKWSSGSEPMSLTAPESDWKNRIVLEACSGTVYSEYSADGAYIDMTPENAALIENAPDDLRWLVAKLKALL